MFSLSFSARALVGLGIIACAACVDAPRSDNEPAPQAFYTVTGEIALSRHEPRVAALEYAAAAETERDPGLLARATAVTAECLQPSLTVDVAHRWIEADPQSVEAERAAGKAALDLHYIDQAAAHYRAVLTRSPQGTDAEFAALEPELAALDDVYGARQLADRLTAAFPDSSAALRLQAYAALRADDPAAAARSFKTALALLGDSPPRELLSGSWRARILAGDAEDPLAQAKAQAERGDSADRLDYAVLLLAAQRLPAARAELSTLAQDPAAAPSALRLLGLVEFQEGRLDAAGLRFAELLTTGKFLDDAFYYLGLIAERREDSERALRFYAQVQGGDNAVPALLRAATILRAHGAAPAAEELFDRLIEEEPQRAPEILANRARIYADAGDGARAATVLEEATLQYPDSVELRYASATLAETQGRVSDSLRELKAVVDERPDDPAALNAYAYTLADHHQRLGVARRLIERAHAASPKNAAILDSLGWVLFRQGHGAEALPYLTDAYADDRGGDIAAHLGEVLWHLQRHDEAERVWSDGDRVDSGNSLLKATRMRLHASN